MKINKRRFKDRYDGKYITKGDPFNKIIPYIMKTRVDSQVHFEDKIYLENIEKFIREIKKEDNINIGFLHIVIAAMVRTMSQKPRINRFVSGRKIFARNEIAISFVVKKELNEDTPETTIKLVFSPNDTIYDIAEKVNHAIEENKNANASNDTDKTARMIMLCPGFFVNFFVSFMSFLDNKGLMPKVINRVSPFHSSLFITNLGSIGIQPVYHHIYNFGTTSLFLAFGVKNRERYLDENGKMIERRFIKVKVVADERICDGFYYSRAFKVFRRIMHKPNVLKNPPQKVVLDNEI